MTTKTIKTILFASLIAAMILPFSGMNFAEAEKQISDTVVDDRLWLKNAKEHKNHEAFMAFANHDMQDNGWNKAMLKENIRNYNIETKIGHDVDGYELVGLNAQSEIINGEYNPSEAEAKFHEWVFTQYDLPQTQSEIDDRIVELVGKNHKTHGKQLVDSLNRMANFGNVSADIHSKAPDFWHKIGTMKFCELSDECDGSELYSEVSQAGIIPVVTYKAHFANIYITYNPCATSGSTCNEYGSNSGTGPTDKEIPGPSHVQDYWIYISQAVWGPSNSNVVVTSQVTDNLTGSNAVLDNDNDGHASGTGYLNNPNASVESQPIITLHAFAYT